MIKVCLNFKIHIPAVRALNELLKTGFYLQNDNNSETEKSIVEKYASNLLPYLKGLESVHLQSNKQFKAGMSVNGITLTHLLKHAPEVIEQLKRMHDAGCIEILSEPWSHSIVPFFDEQTLIRQIKLHDITVESIFGIIPHIFIVHSPAYLVHFVETISTLGKKAVFTNLNQFKDDVYNEYVLENTGNTNHARVLPINYKISKMLQKMDFVLTETGKGSPKQFISRFQNFVNDNNPVIAVYNLTQSNNLFSLSKTVAWQTFLQDMLAKHNIIFTSPSEAVEKYQVVNISNNLANNVFYRSKLDDVWLENKFQNQSFDRQLKINTLMYDEPGKKLIKEWDVLQDMENLFYMNDRFKKNKFAKHYFNLFDNPDIAFFSYMNVLENFMDKLLDGKQKSFREYKNRMHTNKGKIMH